MSDARAQAADVDTPVDRLDELLHLGDPAVLAAIAANPAASDAQLAALVRSRPGDVLRNPRILLHALAGEVPEWLGPDARLLFVLQSHAPIELREALRVSCRPEEALAAGGGSSEWRWTHGRPTPQTVLLFADAVTECLPLPMDVCDRLGPEYRVLGHSPELDRSVADLEARDWAEPATELVGPIAATAALCARPDAPLALVERLARALTRGAAQARVGRSTAHWALKECASRLLAHPALCHRRVELLCAPDDPLAPSGWRMWIAAIVLGEQDPLLSGFARAADPIERRIAAAGTGDPAELARLASDGDALVRAFVASNARAPRWVLVALLSDEVSWVAQAASMHVPPDALGEAARSRWHQVRSVAAKRCSSAELLAELARDPHPDVRFAAARAFTDLALPPRARSQDPR